VTSNGDNQVGPYRLAKWLGVGGMGQVWEAVDCGRGGARVAIKVMTAPAGSRPLRHAMHEARIGLGLDHPNIARTLDVGFAGGRAYIVLELLRGGTLAELSPLPSPPLPTPCVAGLTLQALAGLHHAHTSLDNAGRPRRLVHRDIKGSNLFVTEHGVVKLLDFGIATTRAAPGQEETGPKGTLAYMAPELLAGQDGDGRSDLYALALVAAELLSGRPAFEGLDAARAYAAILRGDIALLRALPGGIPAGVRRWLEIALRRDPRERFDDAASAAGALRACVAAPWGPAALADWCTALPARRPTRRMQTRRLDDHDAASAVAAAPSLPWADIITEWRDPPAAPSPPAIGAPRSTAQPKVPSPRGGASRGARPGADRDRWLIRSIAATTLMLVVGGWPAPTAGVEAIQRDGPRHQRVHVMPGRGEVVSFE
jgi:serine/threonine protein kinase